MNMLTRTMCTAYIHAHKTFHADTHRHSTTYTTHTLIYRNTHTYMRVCAHPHACTPYQHPQCTYVLLHMYVHHIYTTQHVTCKHTPHPGTHSARRAHHPYQPHTTNTHLESRRGPWAVKAERSSSPHMRGSLGREAWVPLPPGGRPALSTPSSRSPGQRGKDRAAADTSLLDPGTPT